jgi:two-component system response regulator FixJ
VPRLVHIVDDDSEVRAGASYALRSYGYETQIYAAGAEFLAEARLDRGCVLLDLRMPGMDGFEVLAALADRGASLPVVILTGEGDVAQAVQAMRRGAVDLVEKPYSLERLLSAVDKAFAAAESSAEARLAKTEAAGRLAALTPRERQVLQGLRAGLANKMIARWLGLSPRTVEAYRAGMMAKIGARGLTDALRIAGEGGLSPMEPVGGVLLH